MHPVYLDLHIHTSEDPNHLNASYNLPLLVQQINRFTKDATFLISLTDHNTINTAIYLQAAQMGINFIVGIELHIRNYDECPAYHCHIYFNLPSIDSKTLKQINEKLDRLYPAKIVDKTDKSIPTIQDVITAFDAYDFLMLPHGGQSHCTFDTSIPAGVKFDTTMERNIYYNLLDGFTARGNKGLEKTQEYFKKLGIADFVNLVTCTDNYKPEEYPKAKAKDASPFVPSWMLAEPTFDGLRLSLSESSRIMYSEIKPTIWSESIRSVKLEKENISIDILLTQGLNVVIGGSSSGKTLLVDSLSNKIANDFSKSNYIKFEVEKLQIDHPSATIPHYLSQNYIMSIVNDTTDNNIENIDIIKNVFPGDHDIREKIDHHLLNLKRQIRELMKCVKAIETEDKNLKKIPILSRLVTIKNTEGNIFKKLQPTKKETAKIDYSQQERQAHIEVLEEIESILAANPFIKHDKTLVPKLIRELEAIFSAFQFSQKVSVIITAEKNRLDRELRSQNEEDQSKKQDFEKMLDSIRNYADNVRKFKKVLKNISKYEVRFDTEQIESMGHQLYIENGFKLNKDIFVDVMNNYMKTGCKIERFKDITPECLFERNYKKLSPKVADYDDFEKRLYKDFESFNRKRYKIVTNDGRDFDTLSAGWKTSVILDIILGYEEDGAPIIIDQPEDNLATSYINGGLVRAIKKIKSKKQVILVSHNATIPMLADAQNVILCTNINNRIQIRSAPLEGRIDGKSVVDYVAEITDGGKSSIKKRVKKYNLKQFKE